MHGGVATGNGLFCVLKKRWACMHAFLTLLYNNQFFLKQQSQLLVLVA
jgi:hypothetical protein